jgi:hypothetical protein
MSTASGMARRTPSRAYSSKERRDRHIGGSGTGARAALTSSVSLRRRQAVPTNATTRPARQPAAMWAAAQRRLTSSCRCATRHRRHQQIAQRKQEAKSGSERPGGAGDGRQERDGGHRQRRPNRVPSGRETDDGQKHDPTGGHESQAASDPRRPTGARRRNDRSGQSGQKRGPEVRQRSAEGDTRGQAAHQVTDEPPRRSGSGESKPPPPAWSRLHVADLHLPVAPSLPRRAPPVNCRAFGALRRGGRSSARGRRTASP